MMSSRSHTRPPAALRIAWQASMMLDAIAASGSAASSLADCHVLRAAPGAIDRYRMTDAVPAGSEEPGQAVASPIEWTKTCPKN
jgi:hypothetical protein